MKANLDAGLFLIGGKHTTRDCYCVNAKCKGQPAYTFDDIA
ncbi:hypothetical protein EGR_05616 [Echinococcus granulosus]|uniref:Uncharacterized protein n=1 Tax=Echinococcus granulosus TaxID=6210 RepID=W6V175_ECHGR|nr:hypothetical protein EGR_05616 [Echinococcus granulosus]EUB59589.1 hypothetical protein EGR_05616 [Echinococcus granulosus]